ncbi:MAG: hypothetical protein GWN67_16570 [Phycisphaerae bacterium]|nr:hypothetical protein [Phycisphaerae bacterium]NIS52768.1 hypothetical protein [Phycisphaerae bacterium]NIU08224.1 hypothetical protein [Phycisphaerae bacterium]NIU57942.1 hypothetical protein [Phycisphaerae bacterium]NIW92218.1 hypothetical protein [Phycisphaerae bacterium]
MPRFPAELYNRDFRDHQFVRRAYIVGRYADWPGGGIHLRGLQRGRRPNLERSETDHVGPSRCPADDLSFW